MPSLEKKKDQKSINLYINKFKNNFVLSDKLDGYLQCIIMVNYIKR